MNSNTASVRINQRLNKLSSLDYKNIKDWQKEEAANKAVLDYFRRNKHGGNQYREREESTVDKVDDFQVLLKNQELSIGKRNLYVETFKLPKDYLFYKRLTPICSKGNCSNVGIKSTLVEEANVDEYLMDYNSQPSFDFEETFHTLISNRFRVYHNDDFDVNKVNLTYYKKPAKINFVDKSLADLDWEWGETMAEQIIDETCKILAGDMENVNAYQKSDISVKENN